MLCAMMTTAMTTSRVPFFRVRTLDAHVSDMLAIGYQRSATFRGLIDTLEDSDVIVYVERRAIVSGTAFLQFVTQAGGNRYVRITLDTELTANAGVALLGHELQHAVEVARAPWVVDIAAFGDLYRAIGHSSCEEPQRCFDTTAAVDAGRRVRMELRHRPAAAD
jgi:hypothetical protein